MPSLNERLITYGAPKLSNPKLLSIVIGGNLDTAAEMLNKNEGLFLIDSEIPELTEFNGIGEAAASRLKAAMELSKRLLFVTPQYKSLIQSPKDAANLLQADIGFLDREAVRAINLNSANYVIAIDAVSIGGLASAPIHPREIFKAPLKRSAAGIVVVHNHPSGELKPSQQDLNETRRLAAVGELLGIPLFDHIIISRGKYFSLLEAGKMPPADTKREAS
jgi:DNA repair protein RadC